MLQVKGLVPNRPTKKPLQVQDLKQGQLAVIIEAGDYFGFHVLMVSDSESSWIVCLNDATIKSGMRDCFCRLMKSGDKITLQEDN